MTTLKAARSAQNPQVASFKFTMADAMIDTSGALTNFKATAGVFEPIPLPIGAIMIGGDVTVEVASDETGTATISIGDSGSATRYANAVNLKAAARTALTLTGYKGTGEDLRITLANQNGNAAAGTVSIRAEYIIDGRATEVVVK
jgi:hypothetical protein